MSAPDPYSVPDGNTLYKLDNGLEIVRRRKHEWQDSLNGLDEKHLAVRTNKIWGSKFLADWRLAALVEWITSVIEAENWQLQPGQASTADRLLDRKIGLVTGKTTRKIRVVSDGRYVHAYPIGE